MSVRGLREHERENRDSLLALRSVAAQVTPVRLDRISWRCGPAPVSPRSRSRGETLLVLDRRHGLALVRERRVREAEARRALCEHGRDQCERVLARTRRAPRRATRRPRSTASAPPVDEAPIARRRSAAFRWPTAAAYSIGRVARAGNTRPTVLSRYALLTAGAPLTTASRSGVKTSVRSSCRSCSAELSAPPFKRARRASRGPRLTSVSKRGLPVDAAKPNASSPQRRSGRVERPYATVVRSPAFRHEAPRAGSSCPTPFGPVTSTTPGSRASSSRGYERKSRSVTSRTMRPARGWRQSGSRIGMIRYEKLSSGETIRPGRSGLISLSWTVSPVTASRPSLRKSGLKPISSGSPA